MKGEMLGGRYLLEDRIGGGGMAWVWRAQDTLLHRPVAIKLLREEFVGDEAFIRRFRQEAQAAASLVHPNVVHVYDVGEERRMHYIVMELVEGETLKENIQRQGPMSVARSLHVATAVARALQAAHRKGIVHRDIKPQNILLTSEGRTKVADFGIARAASGTTIVHTNTIIGSAHYFAPEQARGGFTDMKSDLYSLGAVLYEMLTGQPPFEGSTPVAVALKHLQEAPVSLRKRRPEIPRSVEAIVMRLLEKDPANRYQSVDALLSDLHRALDEIGEPLGEEGAEQEPVPTRVARRRPRRHRIWPWALVLVAIAVLVFGGVKALSAWIAVPPVRVAKVEGLPLARAEQRLGAEGLHSAVVGHDHAKAPKGTVVHQDPAAGDVVKRGRVVQLLVSLGPQLVSVPDVKDQSQQNATATLQSWGLVAVPKQQQSSAPKGTVLQQSPASGQRIPVGDKVQIVVSMGPGQTEATIPDLTGITIPVAESELTALGVPTSTIDYAYSSASVGTVLDQSIPPGTRPQAGMTIVLTASEGLPPSGGTGPPGGPEAIQVTYAGQGSAVVEIWLVDATGSKMIFNNTVQSGVPVTINVSWQGQGRIEEYLNQTLVYSQPLPIEGGITTK